MTCSNAAQACNEDASRRTFGVYLAASGFAPARMESRRRPAHCAVRQIHSIAGFGRFWVRMSGFEATPSPSVLDKSRLQERAAGLQ